MEKNIEENHQNEQNKTFPMEYLPEQVVSEVFQYLDTKGTLIISYRHHNNKLTMDLLNRSKSNGASEP